VFLVESDERERYKRIKELLDAFGQYTDRRASVMLDLSDDQTPNDGPWPKLKEAGLPLSAGMRTAQLMERCAAREGNPGGKVDREQRDYAVLPLRELGIVEKAFVVPQPELVAFGGELVVRGFHRSKSGNNAYVLTEEARDLLAVQEDEWASRLSEFVTADPNRRVRRLEKLSQERVQRVTSGKSRHAALIEASVEALQQTRCQDFELVFIDDADGDRIRDEWRQKLEPLGLMPDLDSRWPDAILVRGNEVWFVDAVVSDGEIDPVRKEELEAWASSKGFLAAGHTTAYEDWKRAGARQSGHKNLAVGSTLWIAEDGGKLLAIESLAG
jgi:hypothetical protein